MPFERSSWPLFTCEEIFEPPGTSAPNATTSAGSLQRLQASISFPGFAHPEGRFEKPVNLSVGKVFTSAVQHLFANILSKNHPHARDVAKLHQDMLDAVTEDLELSKEREAARNTQASTGSRGNESAFIRQWLKARKEEIIRILQSSPAEMTLAYLLLDLLSYYDETMQLSLLQPAVST